MPLIFWAPESLAFIDKHNKKNLIAKAKQDSEVKALLAQKKTITSKINNKINELVAEYVKMLYWGMSG